MNERFPRTPEIAKSELSPRELASLKKALDTFSSERSGIHSFQNEYPPEELQKDKKEVERLKKLFRDEETDNEHEIYFYASVLEMVVTEFGSSWIPGYLSRSSEFDDIKNGIDLALEMQSDQGDHVVVAIDVTSSQEKAEKKYLDTLDNLKANRLSRFKYFESELSDVRGGVEAPKVIVGAERPEIIELAKLYLNYAEGSDRTAAAEKIANHRFGNELRAEIMSQLKKQLEIMHETHARNELITYMETAIVLLENKEAPETNESSGSHNGVLDVIVETSARSL